MNIKQKFKQAISKYGVFLLLFIVMGAIISFGPGDEKKESVSFETCYAYNSFFNLGFAGEWYWEDGNRYNHDISGLSSKQALCRNAGCIIARIPKTGPDNRVCVPYGIDGFAVSSIQHCKPGLCAGASYGDGLTICRECREGEKPGLDLCNARERQIAQMVLDTGLTENCKTAYWITILGIPFLMLLLLVAFM